MFSKKLQTLIETLTYLPTVGNKTAQRMAIHLLQNDRQAATLIAKSLLDTVENIQNCHGCRNLSETPLCLICSDKARDDSLLCLVEGPLDVLAIEQSTDFKGKYFVLMGSLSPIDGIGPKEIGLDQLESQLKENPIKELILATSTTVEGEATAFYISELATKYEIKVSRIAHGIPMGGELEYIDKTTLGHAFNSRTLF